MEKNFDLWVFSHPTLKKLIMELKIALLIIVISVSNVFATPTYSQIAKVSLNMENKSLEQVMDEIERQSEFYFIFNQKQIDVNRIVNIREENKLITDILPELFVGTNVNYAVIDRKILLTTDPLENNLQAIASGPELQQNRITGTVTGTDGTPLPGVNVVITGTTQGMLTDIDGKYSIVVPPGSKSLTFSFIGMEPQEISIGTLTQINVTMAESTIGLEEVVVIGYGTQKKGNVIGSITTVTNEEINTAPVSMVSNALAGITPGVIVEQGSGEPGNNASVILIRGKATLGNNSPLVVVDGIPDRDMNSLQPTDIASITVLKDASAAIYGARSANGVILITTKRGTEGAPTFNYGFYQGVLSPTKLPELADAATYAQMIREIDTYDNVSESNMMYSLVDVEKYKSGKYPWTHPNTNWYAESLKDYSTTRNHNLSVSGGTQAVTYYGSFGTHYDNGIYKNSESSNYKRYNLKANVNVKVNKFFSVGVDMTGSQENSMFSTSGQSDIFSKLIIDKPTEVALYPNGLPGWGGEDGNNPTVLAGLDPGFNDNKTYRLNTMLSATLNVPGVSGLTLSGYYAYDIYFSVEKYFEKPFTLYSLDTQAYLNAGNTGIEDGSAFVFPILSQKIGSQSRLTDSYSESNRKTFNLKANYDKTIGGVHNVSAFISMESSDYLSKGISAYRTYFISNQLPYLFAGSKTDWSNDGSVSIDSRLNYFGRVMYNFKGTYLLQFSLRRDGSLQFSKENGRWGTFPSVLAGWRISNENFWKNNVKFIDYFKLKASYGKMGNDRVAAFQYLTTYGFATGAVFSESKVVSPGLQKEGNPNPFITWEVANIINAGFESTLLNNKVTFNTDFFYQRRNKILVKRNASVPQFTGIALPDENFGIVDNRGFEIELGFNDRKGDFSYGINGNIAFARNKIVEFDEPARNVPWQVRTGHPQGALLLYKSAGIFRDEEQVNSLPHVPGAGPGDIIIVDFDKNGVINSDDMILFDKTADPELTYGMTFNLSYKNWNLRGLIQGAGITMRDETDLLTNGGRNGNFLAYQAEDRWTVDNIDASKQKAYDCDEALWRRDYPVDFYYMKGGYGRLKNLRLSYSIPQRLLNVIRMKDAQLYLSGENLLLIYSHNKITDPEADAIRNYPIMKVYALGVNVTF